MGILEQILTIAVGVFFLFLIAYLLVIAPIEQALNSTERLISRRNVGKLRKILLTPGNNDARVISALEEIALKDPEPEKRSKAAFAIAEGLIFDSNHTEHVLSTLLQSTEASADAQIAKEIFSHHTFFRIAPEGKLTPEDLQFNGLACQICQKLLPKIPLENQSNFVGSTIVIGAHRHSEDCLQNVLIQSGESVIPALEQIVQSWKFDQRFFTILPVLFRLAVENNRPDQASLSLIKLENAPVDALQAPLVFKSAREIVPYLKTSEQNEVITRSVKTWWNRYPKMTYEAVGILSDLRYPPENIQNQILYFLVAHQWEKIKEVGEDAKHLLLVDAAHPSQKISGLATQALGNMSISVGRCDVCDKVYDMKEAVKETYYVSATEEQQYYGVEDKMYTRLRCPNCSSNYELMKPDDDRFYR